MRFEVRLSDRALKDLKKFDRYTRALLLNWIEKRLNGCEDPRAFGKPLEENLKGKWRYRVGDYRIICRIEDEEIIILVLQIGHRRDIYKI